MAAHRSPFAPAAMLGIGLLGLVAAPGAARAEEPKPPSEPRRANVQIVEILESLDRPEAGKDWLDIQLDRLALHKKYGLTYTHSVRAGQRTFFVTIRGPVLGKILSSRRKVGLSFEIEF